MTLLSDQIVVGVGATKLVDNEFGVSAIQAKLRNVTGSASVFLGSSDVSIDGNERQQLTVDATGGQEKLSFSSQQTADIAYNANAAALKTALAALSNLDAADLTTSGGPGNSGGTTPYIITFGGQYAGIDVPQLTVQAGTTPLSGGGHTASVITLVEGGSPGFAWLTTDVFQDFRVEPGETLWACVDTTPQTVHLLGLPVSR